MRIIKHSFIVILIFGGLVLIVNQAFLYGSNTTHPYLVEEMVKIYNYYYDPDITLDSEYLKQMKKGSTDEDTWPRNWFYHFYDPIHPGSEVLSAKEWAQSPEKQAGEPGGDHSWQTAISEYNAGYKQKAFYSLGYILHLIEDMAVPAHTRNDAHYNGGDPLENWAGDLPKDSELYNIAQSLINKGIKPKSFNNLNTYFDETANFSNQNFFSKNSIDDTIDDYGKIKSDARYSGPNIVKEVFNTRYIGYAYGKVDNYFGLIRLLKIEQNDRGKKIYSLDDTTSEIHADYFSILSKEAVINGAGIIKLFFDSITEPEKEIAEQEKQLSFLQKIIGAVVGAIESGTKFVTSVIDGIKHVPSSTIDSAIEEITSEIKPEYLTTSPLMFNEISKAKESTAAVQPLVQEPPTTNEPEIQLGGATPKSEIEPENTEQHESQKNIASGQGNIIVVSGPKTGGSSGTPSSQNQDNNQEQSSSVSEETFASASDETPASDESAVDESVDNPEVGQQPEQDITPPDIAFNPLTYNYASSSTTLQWSSSEIPSVSFDVEYKIGEGDWQNLLASISETHASLSVSVQDIIYYFQVRGRDLLNNQSAWQETQIEILSKPVVINEVAWMGTKAEYNDEWIEFFNRADYDIDLTSWSLKANDSSPDIVFVDGDKENKITVNKIIKAKGHYLLERTSDNATNQPADWYGSFGSGGLNNSGEILELRDGANNLIDSVNSWYAGDNEQKKTMERINPDRPGTNSKNWKTYIGSGSSTLDAGGNSIFGTPKEQNSVYKLYTAVTENIAADTVWTKDNSPYLIYDASGGPNELLEVIQDATLTIEPGVIVKFYNPGLKVFGNIKAEGTSDNPIIFTNYSDESKAGDWSGIWITENSTDSVFDHVIVKYAGSRTRPFRSGYTYSSVAVGAGIRVENTSIILKNSTIENNLFKGVWLINSPNTIIENSTFQNHLEYDYLSSAPQVSPFMRNIALYIDNSNPKIKNSTFQNNIMGIYIINSNQPIIEDNQFSHNSYPIWVENSYPQFSNNQIENNHWNGIILRNLKISQNYTLDGDSVYINYHEIPSDGIVVAQGAVLTIESGAVIKGVYSTSGFTIDGTLIAEGTSEKPIVFTSFYDDEYGGDTNGDGDASKDNVQPGSWGQIIFTSTSVNSSLNYVIIRYGGTKWGQCYNFQPDYVLKIEDSSLSLANSIIENNTSGFRMEDSSSQIANTEFRDHRYSRPFSYFTSTGIYLSSSRPIMDASTFLNNKLGIYIDAASLPSLLNLIFSGNDKDQEDLRPAT